MGASNVAMAYQMYAGKVPATSFQALAYMALVSKDADDRPWFSKGREALAVHALGRPGPFDRADAMAVERAVKPLFDVGAIETDRRSSIRRDGDSTARYRLNLNPARPPQEKVHAPRKPRGVKGAQDPHHPSVSVTDAPRKPCARPTETVLTPHENRGVEDKEDLSRSEIEEEMAVVETAVTVPRAIAEPTSKPPRDPTKCFHGIKIKIRADGTSSCAACRRAERPPELDPPPPPPRCNHGMPVIDGRVACSTSRPQRLAPIVHLDSRRRA